MDVGWLDTNVLVYALQSGDKGDACLALITGLRQGTAQSCLHPLVLHEFSYVVRNLLKWDRPKIAAWLASLVAAPGIVVPGGKEALLDGIARWGSTVGTSFTDALLAAEASAAGQPVCTFDSGDMDRLGVRSQAPALGRNGRLRVASAPRADRSEDT